MTRFYIFKDSKRTFKGFFEEGTWNWENTTSVIVRRDKDFSLIQIFGAEGTYGNVGDDVELINDQTGRSLGSGTIVKTNVKEIANCSAYYVFK